MNAQERRERAVDTLGRAGASCALVFGSRARGDHRHDSDLDVGAWGPRRTELVGHRGARCVDLVVSNTAPLEPADTP